MRLEERFEDDEPGARIQAEVDGVIKTVSLAQYLAIKEAE
jgi:hypothetical protein